MVELVQRFYKKVGVEERGSGFAVTLDGRTLKTPGRAPFVTPTQALAEACAAEWDAQQDLVDPTAMPLTRLANVAIDRTPDTRGDLIQTIVGFSGTDVVSHRAVAPGPLVARQTDAWDPLVAWARAELGFNVPVLTGLTIATAEEAAEDRLRSLAAGLDDFKLTGLAHGAGLAGSAVIAFALSHRRLDARGAFEASTLEEQYSLDTWGDDALARKRLDDIHLEFQSLGRFFTALASHEPGANRGTT